MFFIPLVGRSSQNLSASLSNTSRPTCYGLCNGSATVTASGGVPPYYYHWNSTIKDTCTIANLCEGNYSVTVTDSGGSTPVRFSFSLSSPQPLDGMATYTGSPTCMGVPTVVSASGGTAPYKGTGSFITPPGNNYYVVSDDNGCVDTVPVSVPIILIQVSVVTDTACIGGTARAVVSATGGHPPYTGVGTFEVGGGTHYFAVYDSMGCFGTDTVVIPTYSEKNVTITISDTATICANDSVHIAAPSGFASYLWSVTGSTDSFTNGQLAGNYYVIVTDQHNCPIESNVIPVHVYPSTPVPISASGDTLRTFNGKTYQWYYDGNAIPGAIGQLLVAEHTGEYAVALTDTYDCRYMSTGVTVYVTVGIDNLSHQTLQLYPNPTTSSNFRLTVTNDLLGGILTLYDDNGRLIYTCKIESLSTQLTLDVARGTYVMRLLSGDKAIEGKLIRL